MEAIVCFHLQNKTSVFSPQRPVIKKQYNSYRINTAFAVIQALIRFLVYGIIKGAVATLKINRGGWSWQGLRLLLHDVLTFLEWEVIVLLYSDIYWLMGRKLTKLAILKTTSNPGSIEAT